MDRKDMGAHIANDDAPGIIALRVVPTPGVAYLTDHLAADLGVVISASHNPMPDNGIKIFGPGGLKLDDATEDRIEELVRQGPGHRPTGAGIGRIVDAEDALALAAPVARRTRPTTLDELIPAGLSILNQPWMGRPLRLRAISVLVGGSAI